MEENKQVVAEWKQQNQDRLKEIKTFNPDLYSAINMALSYLNKTLTGEELPVEVEETIVKPQPQELSLEDATEKYYSLFSTFFNTKIKVDSTEKSKKFQQLIIDLGGKWNATNVKDARLRKEVNFTGYKYLGVSDSGTLLFYPDTTFEDDYLAKEIFYDDIFKVKPIENKIESTTNESTSANGYKISIDTYPITLKFQYQFSPNDGSRQSPTQSAGDLKRQLSNMGIDEVEEIRNTKFRGNDGAWYEINVGKGGTWTWRKLNPVENYKTQVKFIEATQPTTTSTPAASQPTPTPEPAQTQPIKFSFYDLVGRQLDWNGSVYKVLDLKKINPKKIVYRFMNSNGGIETVNVPKGVVEALLTESRIVAGVKLLPKQVTSTQYDYSTMSDIELKTLSKDTQEARDAFEFDDPEYAELTTQVGLMIDEMKRRNIL